MGEKVSAWIARLGAPAFRRIYRFDRAFRRRLTPAGWLAAAALLVAMIFGFNTREAAVYQLFGLTAALFLVAMVAAFRLPLAPRVSRRLPEVATAGVAFEYTLRVASGASRPYDALVVEDLLALPPPDVKGFARYKVSSDRSRNAFDRLVGYPRWVAFMRERIGGAIEPAELGTMAPGAEREVLMRCTPLRRGVLQFESVRIARAEPLGLMKAHASQPLPATLLVLPRTHPVAPLDLPGSRRLQPGGVAFAGRVGEAEEFVSLRDYRHGDTPRRIHWKAWARTGRPVVKEYQDEFFVRHALVLDTFGDGDSERFEAAVSIAASHVMQPRSNDALLDLMFVEGQAYTLTQGRGLGAPAELLRVLATVSDSHGAGFAALAEAVSLSAHRLSGAICVLLSWDEARRTLVAGLRARGIPVRVWLVAREGERHDPGPMAGDAAHFRVVAPAGVAAELARP
jgi:uncharacterized protein (DUF58 family)